MRFKNENINDTAVNLCSETPIQLKYSYLQRELQNIKSRFTDRLESALNQLGDANTRYANLLSSFENSREELETSRMELKEARQMIPELEKTVTKLQLDIESRELLVSHLIA